MLTKKLAVNFFIILLSFLFTLASLEILIRLYQKAYYDRPVFDFLDYEPGVKPNTGKRLTLEDSSLGWKAGENFQENDKLVKDESGRSYSISISTNEFGFRLFGKLDSPTDQSLTKILILGDSFTQAADVSNEQTYYYRLSKLLPLSVYAYGAGGWGTLQEYILFDRFVDLIKPSIVLMQLCTNDLINNSHELESRSTSNNNTHVRPYMLPDGTIYYKYPALSTFGELLNSWLSKNSRLSYLVLNRTKMFIKRFNKTGSIEDQIQAMNGNVTSFKDSVEVTKIILKKFKTRFPDASYYAFIADDSFSVIYEELKRVAEEAGFKFIDNVPAKINNLHDSGTEIHAEDGGHWNDLGHNAVAEILAEYFKQELSAPTQNAN